MTYILSEGELEEPADPIAIKELLSCISVDLPRDYIDFLRQHNGGEGFIGNNYIVLWRAQEIIPLNREYEVEEYAPGILLFGSDGGGEGYGYDTQSADMPIVRIPFIGMSRRDAIPIAKNFREFFNKLADML